MRTTAGAEARLLERGASVRRLADDLDRLVAREHRLEAGAHEVVVVHEEDADRRLAHGPRLSVGQPGADAEGAVVRACLEGAAEKLGALAHAHDAVAAAVALGTGSAPPGW